MAIVEPLSTLENGRRRLGLRSPRDRSAIGEITVANADDVREMIARARVAQVKWAARPVHERAALVDKAIELLVERRNEIVDTVMAETGKTRVEALAIEIVAACEFMNYWASRAPSDLRDEPVKLHGYLRPYKKLLMHYKPLGVVGVITPWNGPFALAMNPTVQALLAGNAVILKPSEVSPYSSEWAARLLHESGIPEDVLQVAHGDGETGAALVSGGVQKISFTGSVATGKKIALACAEQLIPCTLELGGKDPMIVCEDADLERAANGAIFNSCMNSGHVCMGVERVYVVESVADEFIRIVEEKMKAMRVGPGDDADVGAVFWDRQLAIIEKHIEDAKKKGANIRVGGTMLPGPGIFFQPTLVTDVDHNMLIMKDETFGPIVAVMRAKDVDEAIALANDSPYGLSGSVWTKDKERGIAIAKRMQTGSVVINDASMAYGVPEAPFGGLKDSGVGQVNGRGAIRSYTHPQPIVIDRWMMKTEEVWYPHDEKTIKALDGIVRYVFGTAMRKLPFFS
ncbi:MAG: aldehyde dehydrogenase family protein [Polyangiales bacterium]